MESGRLENTNGSLPASLAVPDDVRSVCAVLVTYFPDCGLLEEALAAVRPQVSKVVIVDNGSPEETLARLMEQETKGRLTLIPLGENLGIAAAQNRGITRALEQGHSHVLLLDQDSVPAPDMVGRLLEAERSLSGQGERVGAVGPRFVDPDTGAVTWFHGRGPVRFSYLKCGNEGAGAVVRPDFLIASGTLIPSAVLVAVGGMDESLFIDLVDIEWCLRVAAAGHGIFGACDAVMEHRLGRRTIQLPANAGRRGTIPVHASQRYYYAFRNSLLIARKQHVPLWWVWNNGVQLLFMLFFFPLTTPPRLTILVMMLRGFFDGLRGRSGQCSR